LLKMAYISFRDVRRAFQCGIYLIYGYKFRPAWNMPTR
jgi:hypothetical protein